MYATTLYFYNVNLDRTEVKKKAAGILIEELCSTAAYHITRRRDGNFNEVNNNSILVFQLLAEGQKA